MWKRLGRLAAMLAFAVREWRTSDAPETQRGPYRGPHSHRAPIDGPDSHRAPSVSLHNPGGGA